MAGGVLALDLSSNTGWAVGRLPAAPLTLLEAAAAHAPQPLSGVARFRGEVGPFLTEFGRWLDRMVVEHQPSGLIFESPILPQKTTPQTVRKLMGLVGVTLMVAHRRNIRWVREGQPSSVKKHFCGSGKPGKQGVMDACKSRGWTHDDDNEADALALFDYAATLYANERRSAE